MRLGSLWRDWDRMGWQGRLIITLFWFEPDEIKEQKFLRTKWKIGTIYLPMDFLLDLSLMVDGES
jgi:hypothetical protein